MIEIITITTSSQNTINIAITIIKAWSVYSIVNEFYFQVISPKNGIYIEALGGYTQTYGEDLLETAEFIGDNAVFSTYASAQELLSGTFQPSGTDYIIHTLGSESRKNYLSCFTNGTFTYTSTIKESFNFYEYWVQRANWFFYRQLYRDWHPVYANTYALYWERNDEDSSFDLPFDGSIEIQELSESTKKIIVNTDPSVNGVADVFLDYQINKTEKLLSQLVFSPKLYLSNTSPYFNNSINESNFLPEASQEYIPIPIANGYGELTLTSEPQNHVTLSINEVSCRTVHTVTQRYVEVEKITSNGDTTILDIPNQAPYPSILSHAKAILINDTTYQILSTESTENSDATIQVTIATNGNSIDPNGNLLTFANMFEIF